MAWCSGWNFSLYHRVQNCSGAHPVSYSMGTGGSFPGVKRPGREADQSPPTSAEVKSAGNYTSTPQYVLMTWCLVQHSDFLLVMLLSRLYIQK